MLEGMLGMNRNRMGIAAAALVAGLLSTWSQPAHACGGFFCDGGGPPMPVDQTGETIVFVMDGASVEAHIQIQYMGEAENFSWVIPVMSRPDFAVGSQPLLDAMLVGTQPRHQAQWQYDDCGDPSPESTGGLSSGGATGGDGGDDGDGDSGGDGPQVVHREVVGAFEAVVLEGGTAQEVIDWLDANGYAQDPEAEPILQKYLDDGALFAALKLTGGTDVDEIHPIVLRFTEGEPCVPLTLTRIAAVEDMDVRAMFLAPARVAPTNFRHVLVNPARIDWLSGGANYRDVVTLAVDEENADGRAFVTEYAGTADVVQARNFIFNEVWDDSVFVTAEPTQVMDLLQAQNMGGCFGEGGGCQWGHPLVLSLLRQYLPAPDGVPEDGFYANPAGYTIDTAAWDGAAFAADYRGRIIDPGQAALTALEAAPSLTRMFTTISPAEMTEDPIFHVNSDLQDVPNVQTATIRQFCSGDRLVTLPDGRQVFLGAGEPWPDFGGEMPWSEEIERVPTAGGPESLTDNTELIDQLLAEYNDDHEPDRGSGGGQDGVESESAGCACTTGGAGAFGWTLVGALGAFVRRRRR